MTIDQWCACRNHISNRRLSGSKEKNNINLTHRILEEEKRSGAKGSQRPSGELRDFPYAYNIKESTS